MTNDNNGAVLGQPAISPSGTLTYTPDANYNGSATFTVHDHDDGGTANSGVDTSATQTVTITVTEVNDAPIAGDDSDTVAEDGSVTTSVLANDSTGPANESSQTLTVTAVTQGANGTVTTERHDRHLHPDANYNGPRQLHLHGHRRRHDQRRQPIPSATPPP